MNTEPSWPGWVRPDGYWRPVGIPDDGHRVLQWV